MKKISQTTKITFDPSYMKFQNLESKKIDRKAFKVAIKKRAIDFVINSIDKIRDIENKIDSYLNKNSDQAFILVFVLAGLVYLYGPMAILWLAGVK